MKPNISLPQKIIDAFDAAHSGKYDYSKSIYIRDKEKIEIICPHHGSFWQIPHAHKRGQKCPHCSKMEKRMTINDFVARAKIIHGDKYDYSLTCYINSTTKIIIRCAKHGTFSCTPSNHLSAVSPTGCPECGMESKKIKKLQRGYSTFKKRSTVVHGDRFDYSEVIYKGAHIPVEIICKIHGSFWQTPANHYSGHVCARCAHEGRPISRGENTIRDWLVFHEIPFERERTFDDLRNPITGRHLRYDFFIPDQKIIIEFDGEHHFEPVRGDIDRLRKIQELDAIKNEYAKRNGLTMIRISDRNMISQVLEHKLKKLPS